MIKMLSWNVNGIRAIIKKDFAKIISNIDADVVCLQETKAQEDQVDLSKVTEFECYKHSFWNSAQKKGYSGTLTMSKQKPDSVSYGIGIKEHDLEGRVVCCEYSDFYLVNVYVPNSQSQLRRLSYRQRWDADFLKYLKSLEEKKSVIVCGDLNVAHKEIDLANPSANRKNAGFSDEERSGMDNFLSSGFIDSYRFFDKSAEKYTWWSYRTRARDRNIGWRIDYFLVSENMEDKLLSAKIHADVYGSDHCPVSLELDISP